MARQHARLASHRRVVAHACLAVRLYRGHGCVCRYLCASQKRACTLQGLVLLPRWRPTCRAALSPSLLLRLLSSPRNRYSTAMLASCGANSRARSQPRRSSPPPGSVGRRGRAR